MVKGDSDAVRWDKEVMFHCVGVEGGGVAWSRARDDSIVSQKGVWRWRSEVVKRQRMSINSHCTKGVAGMCILVLAVNAYTVPSPLSPGRLWISVKAAGCAVHKANEPPLFSLLVLWCLNAS